MRGYGCIYEKDNIHIGASKPLEVALLACACTVRTCSGYFSCTDDEVERLPFLSSSQSEGDICYLFAMRILKSGYPDEHKWEPTGKLPYASDLLRLVMATYQQELLSALDLIALHLRSSKKLNEKSCDHIHERYTNLATHPEIYQFVYIAFRGDRNLSILIEKTLRHIGACHHTQNFGCRIKVVDKIKQLTQAIHESFEQHIASSSDKIQAIFKKYLQCVQGIILLAIDVWHAEDLVQVAGLPQAARKIETVSLETDQKSILQWKQMLGIKGSPNSSLMPPSKRSKVVQTDNDPLNTYALEETDPAMSSSDPPHSRSAASSSLLSTVTSSMVPRRPTPRINPTATPAITPKCIPSSEAKSSSTTVNSQFQSCTENHSLTSTTSSRYLSACDGTPPPSLNLNQRKWITFREFDPPFIPCRWRSSRFRTFSAQCIDNRPTDIRSTVSEAASINDFCWPSNPRYMRNANPSSPVRQESPETYSPFPQVSSYEHVSENEERVQHQDTDDAWNYAVQCGGASSVDAREQAIREQYQRSRENHIYDTVAPEDDDGVAPRIWDFSRDPQPPPDATDGKVRHSHAWNHAVQYGGGSSVGARDQGYFWRPRESHIYDTVAPEDADGVASRIWDFLKNIQPPSDATDEEVEHINARLHHEQSLREPRRQAQTPHPNAPRHRFHHDEAGAFHWHSNEIYRAKDEPSSAEPLCIPDIHQAGRSDFSQPLEMNTHIYQEFGSLRPRERFGGEEFPNAKHDVSSGCFDMLCGGISQGCRDGSPDRKY